ncbi:unnamed protein product [Meganyctiphanes norvegica]|uniref:Uncharacterized protein n=1 Tax=Meganyctiphanes norvegica TaxID=48144 RepID=A0AAV2PY08_MEGNR
MNGRQSAANKDNEFSSLVNYICQLCRCNIRTKKANILCNNCLNSYHPGCFKKINIDNKSCNMCISMELPFHDFIGNGEILAVLPDDNNNNITPSEAPEDIFDVFKNKGLHFIHINARSMFHKLSELVYIAKKLNQQSYQLPRLGLTNLILTTVFVLKVITLFEGTGQLMGEGSACI